jgi:transcriptional regulator with XRE-family HTH domain
MGASSAPGHPIVRAASGIVRPGRTIVAARSGRSDQTIANRAIVKPMLHDEVRAAREALGMSQRKLAELAGIPRSQLSAFEAHGTNITLETLRKLVTVLPNVTQLSLGVRDVQVNAALSGAAMQHALTDLRRATDTILALAGRGPAGATEFREGGTEVSAEQTRKLARAAAKAKSRVRRKAL